LTVKLDPGEERRTVILRDDWTYTDIRTGDTINIIGPFTPIPSPSHAHPQLSSAPPPTSTITLTSSSNLLILHPDTLLTATALSTAPTCTRKPLLQMLVHSSSDITPSLVWGNVLHEVMQGCLREGKWGGGWIDEQIERVVRGAGGEGRGMGDLVRLGVGVEEAVREVKARAGGLKTFGERYMAQSPKVLVSLYS
jgi:DNA replication ATP-dependent helicase Dna2